MVMGGGYTRGWVGYGEEDCKMPPAKAILLVKIIPGVLAGDSLVLIPPFVHLSLLARDNKINRGGTKTSLSRCIFMPQMTLQSA